VEVTQLIQQLTSLAFEEDVSLVCFAIFLRIRGQQKLFPIGSISISILIGHPIEVGLFTWQIGSDNIRSFYPGLGSNSDSEILAWTSGRCLTLGDHRFFQLNLPSHNSSANSVIASDEEDTTRHEAESVRAVRRSGRFRYESHGCCCQPHHRFGTN
jgi:hypothetical protein